MNVAQGLRIYGLQVIAQRGQGGFGVPGEGVGGFAGEGVGRCGAGLAGRVHGQIHGLAPSWAAVSKWANKAATALR